LSRSWDLPRKVLATFLLDLPTLRYEAGERKVSRAGIWTSTR
jgi:hypothetical protein